MATIIGIRHSNVTCMSIPKNTGVRGKTMDLGDTGSSRVLRMVNGG